MRVLAFPLRIYGNQFATVEQGSPRDAQQHAAAIVSTTLRERPLAPDFGIMDPVGVGVSRSEILAAIALCEPDLTVTAVDITGPTDARQSVSVAVEWSTDDGV